jgi:hypothetical protein
LTVPGLCRDGPGKRCGKRRKWLIYNNFPRPDLSLNPLVEGSNPSGPTKFFDGPASLPGRCRL